MVKKDQRKNYTEGDPEDELLGQGKSHPDVQDKIPGNGNEHGRRIIDVNSADKISGLGLK